MYCAGIRTIFLRTSDSLNVSVLYFDIMKKVKCVSHCLSDFAYDISDCPFIGINVTIAHSFFLDEAQKHNFNQSV